MQHPHLAKHRFRTAVKEGWISFLAAARPHGASAHARAPLPMIDPVALTMLAVNRLGPATVRTAANGKAYTVAVPDARVAEIFRAVLRETQKVRRTDRLVDVVVSGEAER
jgi:hypothetical protein